MRENRLKIYPATSKDTSIKFWFNDNNRHYTIRFAGNPLFIIEQLYTHFGGENFMEVYAKMKNIKTTSEIKKGDTTAMLQAIELSKIFLETLEKIGDSGKSPLVVYADDYINKE